jgi:hypothetical protein
MVGLGRLERPTSPLSGVRSNHLSYRPGLARGGPIVTIAPKGATRDHAAQNVRKEKEKRRRRLSRIAGPDWPHVF